MSAKRRRTPRDTRRRTLSQNFLADGTAVERLIRAVEVEPGQLILDVGAGSGALTLPLARAGASVVAIEPDPAWVERLTRKLVRSGLSDRVTVIRRSFQETSLPAGPYRVVSNPPFSSTTALLSWLLDDPAHGPWRADLLVQAEVARKRAASPPTTLRSAAWAPWWEFHLGPKVPRTAFRPVPRMDAALLTIRRREPPVLPEWLAPELRELLRPGWYPPQRQRQDDG